MTALGKFHDCLWTSTSPSAFPAGNVSGKVWPTLITTQQVGIYPKSSLAWLHYLLHKFSHTNIATSCYLCTAAHASIYWHFAPYVLMLVKYAHLPWKEVLNYVCMAYINFTCYLWMISLDPVEESFKCLVCSVLIPLHLYVLIIVLSTKVGIHYKVTHPTLCPRTLEIAISLRRTISLFLILLHWKVTQEDNGTKWLFVWSKEAVFFTSGSSCTHLFNCD